MKTDDLKFIENRMKELSIGNYHIAPMTIRFEAGQNKESIKAYNEFIYLTKKTSAADVIIQSDNNILHSPQGENFEQLPEEFQGYISIESSSQDQHTLEFIRIIVE